MWLVLQQWLWSPPHWSHCVANCLLLFSFSSGHSHCPSSTRCLWWGHLQLCFTKQSQDHFWEAFWEGIYYQQWEQAPAATDCPSRGLPEIQPDNEWQWMCIYASKCLLSSSLCLTFWTQDSHCFDYFLADFSLFFLIAWFPETVYFSPSHILSPGELWHVKRVLSDQHLVSFWEVTPGKSTFIVKMQKSYVFIVDVSKDLPHKTKCNIARKIQYLWHLFFWNAKKTFGILKQKGFFISSSQHWDTTFTFQRGLLDFCFQYRRQMLPAHRTDQQNLILSS